MDTAFELDEGARANFLKLVMQSFSCSYICLWRSYINHNCLLFFDGVYDEENQAGSSSSSSSGVSLSRRLFDEYRRSVIPIVQNECVPGFAFRNSLAYVELQEMDLQRVASVQIQKLFYQEARIKTAVFMGCKSGEIELGFSNVSQMNVKKELIMRSWMLPEAFSKSQLSPRTVEQQNQLSSSSSSLRSLSTMDSPEYSSLLFNPIQTSTAPTSLNIPADQVFITTNFTSLLQPIVSPTTNIFSSSSTITSTSTSPHQQAMQAFSRIRGNTQFPAREIEDAEITRAILAVLTSPSPSISSHQSVPPALNNDSAPSPSHHGLLNPKPNSSFKNYISSPLAPRTQLTKGAANLGVRKQTMVKRSISFLRSLNQLRIREQGTQATNHPTTSQLHHMISERKRREKLNESFHSLKSLLPPGTKKDKASVLTTARDYLTSLKAQVDELSKRNQQLEAAARLIAKDEEEEAAGSTSTERVSVSLMPVSGSNTDQDQQIFALQVILRSGECSTEDIVIRILEFLKQVKNLSLMSMEASTSKTELHPNINRVVLRLRVDDDQANEWDKSAFQEAVRRVIADMAHK